MPDQVPASPPPPPSSTPAPSTSTVPIGPGDPTTAGPTIRIGDEFGTAKKNLPPAKIVVPAVVVVLIIVGLIAIVDRAKPQGTGSLDNVSAVQVPGQTTTLVALTFTLHNSAEKLLYVRTLQGKVATPSGDFTGDAISAVDFDRYFQLFPTLKDGTQPALTPETQIAPGKSVRATILVSFPINLDVFNQRKSVSAVIQPYDEPLPITLTK